jgi:hypothetical protein
MDKPHATGRLAARDRRIAGPAAGGELIGNSESDMQSG